MKHLIRGRLKIESSMIFFGPFFLCSFTFFFPTACVGFGWRFLRSGSIKKKFSQKKKLQKKWQKVWFRRAPIGCWQLFFCSRRYLFFCFCTRVAVDFLCVCVCFSASDWILPGCIDPGDGHSRPPAPAPHSRRRRRRRRRGAPVATGRRVGSRRNNVDDLAPKKVRPANDCFLSSIWNRFLIVS